MRKLYLTACLCLIASGCSKGAGAGNTGHRNRAGRPDRPSGAELHLGGDSRSRRSRTAPLNWWCSGRCLTVRLCCGTINPCFERRRQGRICAGRHTGESDSDGGNREGHRARAEARFRIRSILRFTERPVRCRRSPRVAGRSSCGEGLRVSSRAAIRRWAYRGVGFLPGVSMVVDGKPMNTVFGHDDFLSTVIPKGLVAKAGHSSDLGEESGQEDFE